MNRFDPNELPDQLPIEPAKEEPRDDPKPGNDPLVRFAFEKRGLAKLEFMPARLELKKEVLGPREFSYAGAVGAVVRAPGGRSD